MEYRKEQTVLRAAGHPDIAASQIISAGSNASAPSKRLPGPNGKSYLVLLDELLGKGAFAQVYKGTIAGSTQVQLAVKVVSQEHLQKWGAKGRKNLEHEVNILQKIKHPNIVRLEDFIQTANNYYLIFEYCAGGDLREYLKTTGPLDELTAQRFIYQLAQALKQLSINEIMHRDLKPQNILLDRRSADAVIKLADFGLAKYYHAVKDDDDSDEDMEHTVAGTPVYMAPEVAGYKAYGKKADLWSCGVVFLEMLVGNRPWEGCTRREEGPGKKAFFYRFSEGSVDLANYGVKVSPLCLALLRGMVQQNPADRMSWSQFFEHPVVKHEPAVYREIVEQITQQPKEYIHNSTTDDKEGGNKASSPDKKSKEEPKQFDGKQAKAEAPAQKQSPEQSIDPRKIANLFKEGNENNSQEDRMQAESPAEHQDSDLAISVPEMRSNSTTGYVEDFIKSQDITCQVVELLHSKAEFLSRMVNFELHNAEQNITSKPYEHRLELRYIVYKLVMEIREVIETFSTREFLGISAAKDSDEQCIQNQIETQEHEQLFQSILNLKEKNQSIRQQYQQRIKVQDRKSEAKEDLLEDDPILRVLHHDGGGSPHQSYRIILTDLLLQKLKESHGGKLIPLVHKLHDKYLLLSNELVNFHDDITDGALEDAKLLGKKLFNYVRTLAEEGAIYESNFGAQAYQKYEEAQFVCNELLRDLNNTLKFSTEYSDHSQPDPVKLKAQKSQQLPTIASFTFVRQDQHGPESSAEAHDQAAVCMFDLKMEKILLGLQKMIARRMETAKKSPYYVQ